MIVFDTVLDPDEVAEPTLELSLDHDHRRRARLRVQLPSGSTVGLALPRGVALRGGDRLRASVTGEVALVREAHESVSVAESSDVHLLARAAYHLGNRHVALRIEPGRLIYPHDHVLDRLCAELGLRVRDETRVFDPEPGGYHHHAN